MSILTTPKLTLEEFLQLPETKPGKEYINGIIIQKPMPKGRHSRLQSKLCNVINNVVESDKIAYAFPELRCTFGGRSIIPDVAVFLWENIVFSDGGEVADDFRIRPNWVIEILSPNQKPNKVIGNILHCLSSGCELGWFIDPDDQSILVFTNGQQPQLLQNTDILPVLAAIDLELTADEIFSWLKMG
ncbi:MAG: Uma2 family endonuclease, partial [Xenococcaceae cyanobacterium MO_188.B19]|nr:Uma2 family endonuclease [Xenococcaceae cyanobacterium MO_188.B19]MDJ0680982.1 Uma2 family endonuclease [Xenococcaceae cyanobacterium MO_167.B52]